jgi:hypothetical protein
MQGRAENEIEMSRKIQYEIRVKGQLDERWTDWFDGMNIESEGGITTLTGPLNDQAALHGILSRIRDLGLPLISAQQFDPEDGTRKPSKDDVRRK